MRKGLIMGGLLGLMCLVGAPSQAQQFDPAMFKLVGPAMRIIGSNPTTLLSNKGVQTELKLDEDQIKQVNEKFPGFGGFGGFGGGKGGNDFMERMTKMAEKAQALKDVPEDKLDDKIREVFKEEIEQPMKDAEKILKPEQLKRLKQISLQNAGIRGYLDEAKGLKLSDEQVKKIKDIRTEMDKDVGEITRAGGKGGKGGFGGGFGLSEEARAKITKLRNEAKDNAEKVLSDEQKKTWKELTGEPFEVKFEFPKFTPKKKKDD